MIQAGISRNDERFEEFEDFTGTKNSSNDSTDHGERSIDLIFKVFNRAKLYVANVLHDDLMVDSETPMNIAKVCCLLTIFFCLVNRTQAIKWALQKDVHIIAIPMGWYTSSPELNKAVQDAAAENILIFASAATGQHGHDIQILYPARLRHVFCIFATDGNGRISAFNPLPRPSTLNFAILGENVQLLKWKNEISGTSIFIAIAAGLSAALLEFAYQTDARKVIGE